MLRFLRLLWSGGVSSPTLIGGAALLPAFWRVVPLSSSFWERCCFSPPLSSPCGWSLLCSVVPLPPPFHLYVGKMRNNTTTSKGGGEESNTTQTDEWRKQYHPQMEMWKNAPPKRARGETAPSQSKRRDSSTLRRRRRSCTIQGKKIASCEVRQLREVRL